MLFWFTFFEVVQDWDKSLIFFLIHYQWFSKHFFFCSKVQSNVDTFWLDSFRAKIPSELGQEAASRSSHGVNYSKIGGSLKLARATSCNFTRKKKLASRPQKFCIGISCFAYQIRKRQIQKMFCKIHVTVPFFPKIEMVKIVEHFFFLVEMIRSFFL